MGDMGDDFNAMKKASQVKRASNRERTAQRLLDAGVPFVSKNGGAHLIVAGVWSMWPGTGLFRHQNLPIEGRGIRSLLEHMEKIK